MKKKEEHQYPYKWVEKRIKSKKPIRNEYGAMLYKDALQYLIRVIPQDNPSFDFILSLASYATSNNLSTKQVKKIDDIISYYEKEGVL